MLKQMIAGIRSSAASLARNEKGNFGIMAAVMAPALLVASGVAINYAYLTNARTNMAYALDIALTSTTRDVIVSGQSDATARAAMNEYLDANRNGGINENITMQLTDLDIDRTARSVSAEVTSNVKVPFALFGMAETWPVVVNAQSSYTDRPIEVAMMLDVTGSMDELGTSKNGRRQTKMQNMQDAASQAIRDLLDRNVPGQQPRVRVALVPYSQGVNTGALSEAAYIENGIIPIKPLGLDELNSSNLPLVRLIKQTLDLLRPTTDRCTTERKTAGGGVDFGDQAPGDSTVNRAIGFEQDQQLARRRGWTDPCPTAAVVPLTANRGALISAVNSFRAGGGTAGHIGIQWTRYVLSPNWGSFLRSKVGTQAVPAAYNNGATAVRKVAILLTDGQFNTAYASGGDSASFARAHCTAMKANVEVFTIGFMLNENEAKATMAACASPDQPGGVKHYYDASNAAELNAAFEAITANAEIIRLTN